MSKQVPQNPKVAKEQFMSATCSHNVLDNPNSQCYVTTFNTFKETYLRFDYHQFANSLPSLTIQDATETSETPMEVAVKNSVLSQPQTGSPEA